MTTLYKLTDEHDQTSGGCQWGENVEVRTHGKGTLCSPGWTHWYTDPLLAVLLNPLHGAFDLATAHLWEGEGEVGATDGLKVGCAVARTIHRVPLPAVTSEQRVRFGIGCAWILCSGDRWRAWARGWLREDDRTSATAAAAAAAARTPRPALRAAAEAAWAAAQAEAATAAQAAAWAAARVAEEAAWSAEAAAQAALAAARGAALAAARGAARVARATGAAAWSAEAAWAARAAAWAAAGVDLPAIAAWAMSDSVDPDEIGEQATGERTQR